MEHDDDGAGPEEEKRFEEGVGEKMEHGGFFGGEADGHDHVAELRKRGVSQNLFNVVLLRGNERRHDRGDRSDPGNDGERIG